MRIIKTIKIIELFNKIAKGEEVPKKISYNHAKYIYSEGTKQYYIEGSIGMCEDSLRYELTSFNKLNDEVEIIEEENKLPKKIKDKYTSQISKIELAQKFNQLIDYLESKETGE